MSEKEVKKTAELETLENFDFSSDENFNIDENFEIVNNFKIERENLKQMESENILKDLLPKDRFEHSKRVKKSAEDLAKKHKVNIENARIAALLHDCSRFLNRQGMLKMAKNLGWKISEIEKFEPKLLHAKLSAEIAKKSFGISNKGVLKAIEEHTVGSENMSLLSKIIYLADHIEIDRDYPNVAIVRKLTNKNLNKAIVASSSQMIQHLLDQGLPIDDQTVKTRNRYLKRKS
jgi:predicted HD superfamily hydrolase involved in NAD metabolism